LTEFNDWQAELAGTRRDGQRWVRPRPPFPLLLAAGLGLGGLILALAIARALSHGA
jgi:hypothetical protein